MQRAPEEMSWTEAMDLATDICHVRPDLHTRIIGGADQWLVAISKKDKYQAPGYYSGKLGNPVLAESRTDWERIQPTL